jgi:hypothetical protein
MPLIEDIHRAIAAHEIACPCSRIKPTVYLGEAQMSAIKALMSIVSTYPIEKNEVGGDMFMGMPMVQVKSADYLRVA